MPKGRTATLEEITSGWPSGRAVLDRFPEHATWEDETMGAYFRMAVRTYEAGVHEAVVFLIGGAAERLLDVAGNKVQHLIPGWDRKKKAKERMDALVALFERRKDSTTSELIEILGNAVRWSRNDVGHPKLAPPAVSPRAALVLICWFPEYVAKLMAAADGVAVGGAP